MANAVTEFGANVPAPNLDGPIVADSVDLSTKYAQEREKRLREDATAQFLDISRASTRLQSLFEDPWVEAGAPINMPVPDGGHCRCLIMGAGFGGILFAVKLLRAGFRAQDIVLVDMAGGFGGTWYYNRYPGLMCDVESYIYMPLLEEMGYMPARKYASGNELREYAESVATKHDLHARAMFQSSVTSLRWDEIRGQWNVKILQKPKGAPQKPLQVSSDFVLVATGVFSSPKLPDLAGMDTFAGDMIHTSRWNYNVTGGSPTDPNLTKLKDKRVGIIGTGATAVQAVPHLARCSKELFVFQRTPSSVDVRNNRDTDASEFHRDIADGAGWQRRRNENFLHFINNHERKPAVDKVADGWTSMPSYSAMIGSPKRVTMENVGEHVAGLHQLDSERQDRIRARAAEIVRDPKVAKNLQAWYPGWCKRPCFHDEYLPAFNSPTVTLVDTDGRGVDRISEHGIVVNGQQFDIDVLVWGTGYDSSIVGHGKSDCEIIGKDGARLDEQFQKGWSTLHGVVSRGYPNMFWPGPLQAAVSANFMFVLEELSTHIAYIITTASRQTGGRPIIEPSADAVEEWATTIMSGAIAMAGMAGCTPSYLNAEGAMERMSPEMQMKAARGGAWATGMLSYLDFVEGWRSDNKLLGLEVTERPKARRGIGGYVMAWLREMDQTVRHSIFFN